MSSDNLSESYKGKSVKYSTWIGRQLSDYNEIKLQLKSIRGLAEYYFKKHMRFAEKYVANPNAHMQIEEDDIYPLSSTLIHIIISYSRCFDSARKQKGKEGRRLVSLQRDFIKNIDPRALATHDLLLNLRNSFVAHAGESIHEKYEYIISVDPYGNVFFGPGENYHTYGSPDIEEGQIELLVDEITKLLNIKIGTLTLKAKEEMFYLNGPARRALVLNKIQAGLPITDKDLE